MFVQNYSIPKAQRSQFYGHKSMGLVVKTPEELEKDNVVGVYIPRLMFGLAISDGAYENDVSFSTDKILNSNTKKIGDTKFKSKNYVTLPIALNGPTMGSRLVKGENVFIEHIDQDIKNMYVLPYTLNETSRRKNDMYTILVPNFKEYGEANNVTIDNSYGFQIDTINKTISLWTNIEGGEGDSGDLEKGKYFMGFSPKEGVILISDTGKRTITINTDEDRITMKNEAETVIEMVEDTINMKCKTMNIEAEDEINITSAKMTRKIDEIETECDTDTEKTDTLNIEGKKLSSKYDDTKVESKTYENKTSKWKCDSPISGFTKILTANEFSIWGDAGTNPPPSCATITSAGIFKAGNPSTPSMGLAKAQPLITILTTMATTMDIVAAAAMCPPTCVASISPQLPTITSTNSNG